MHGRFGRGTRGRRCRAADGGSGEKMGVAAAGYNWRRGGAMYGRFGQGTRGRRCRAADVGFGQNRSGEQQCERFRERTAAN